LVPKAGGGWRLIVDLRKLNLSCVPHRCRYETLRVLNRLARKGDWMTSFDLKDGYHAISIHPQFRRFFSFHMDGEFFQCATLPMGWLNSPFVFTKVMRPMVAYLRAPAARQQQRKTSAQRPVTSGPFEQRTVGLRVLPYLDDFLCLAGSQESAAAGAAFVQRTLERLGLQWHPRKSVWEPCQSLPHLGLTVDTARGLFIVTAQRQQRLRSAAKDLLCAAGRSQRAVPARQLARFTGLAISASLAVPAARLYLRALYDVLATKAAWGAQVRLTRQATRDLEWWLELPNRSVQRPIWRTPATATLHCDASDFGWGAVLNQTDLARGFWSPEQRRRHIQYKELVAVRLAIETWLRRLRGRTVRLWEDNQAVMHIINGRSSRAPALMAEVRRLYSLLDSHGIHLAARYIRSEDNVMADGLSRLQLKDDWQLNPAVFQRFDRRWGPHNTDCFASFLNRQVPRYFSEYADPQTAGVDVFARSVDDWRAHLNWCNPPWGLLLQLVSFLRMSGAAATVVAPYWPGQPWFGPLLEISAEFQVLEPAPDLFLPGRTGHLPMGPPRWQVMVCRVPLRAPGMP
jgi:ribonuclease HI